MRLPIQSFSAAGPWLSFRTVRNLLLVSIAEKQIPHCVRDDTG